LALGWNFGLSLHGLSVYRNDALAQKNLGIYAQSFYQYGANLWHHYGLFYFWRKRKNDFGFLYRRGFDFTISRATSVFEEEITQFRKLCHKKAFQK
jgi:hypothetical protein